VEVKILAVQVKVKVQVKVEVQALEYELGEVYKRLVPGLEEGSR
jgi:hypothetical protein